MSGQTERECCAAIAASHKDVSAKLKRTLKQYRETRKYLRETTQTIDRYLALMDEVIKGPSTVERGMKIAELSNKLDMQNQIAKRFWASK